ncbi:hypothetical protein K450DRAFT_224036 [Umbelopsis ramanniana AG]|uniref:Fe2OG dioxygenase domain-containing protein n=1 Tax=Umbelopsis ramanniana AG TaxID=1314678 RepID=A0AAD5EFS2_UMBRA|nr:uncharacterized protein K450DRAFT_224036 [Umbelopsis ramanniana AG]KAI8583063.1 hypothetical protein K450DRAFT_224036 [Umbelopsis ramanniana AG]
MEEIPVIDFGKFDSDPVAVAAAIREACESIGFLFLKNVGIPQPEIDEMFELGKEFFDQPVETKAQFDIQANNVGYSALHREVLDPATQKTGDSKEAFNFGKWLNGEAAGEMPEPFKAKEDITRKFSEDCHKVCSRILQAFAIALEIKEEDGGIHYFEKRHDYDTPCGSILRLLKYPKGGDTDTDEIVRAGSHSDYGSITLLFQHGIPGLEVQASRTNWISAPVIPGAVLVNIGDQMEYWTGGRFKSTKHRVVFLPEHAQNDRYSIAYFCHANDEVPLDVIPSVVLKDNQIGQDQPIKTAGQHLRERLEETYKFSESAM